MDTGTGALILFFGVHWGILISAVGKYRLFSTHLLFDRNTWQRASLRLVLGLLVVNAAPVLLLWVLYNSVVSPKTGPLPIASAAVASLAVYGFNRLVHAFVATDRFHSVFYSQQEHKDVLGEWDRRGPNTFWPHFLPAIDFLVGFPFVAWLLGGR